MRHLFFLQQFFERLPAPAFIKDNKFRLVWVNKEWKKVFGLDDRKVIGKTISEIFGDGEYEKQDKSIVRSKKPFTYETDIGSKHYRVIKIPIRLGDGTYGVAGVAFDITDKHIGEILLKTNVKLSTLLNEAFEEVPEDKDILIEYFFDKVYETTNIGPWALIKGEDVLKTYLPEKVCERAKSKEGIKEFSVDGEKWLVVPIENYKIVFKSSPLRLKIMNQLAPILVPKIEVALQKIEIESKKQNYYRALEKMVETVVEWNNKGSLQDFMQKALEKIVEIIPEAEKGSVWLYSENTYDCIAEIGYPGATQLKFAAEKTAYGQKITEMIEEGYKVFEIERAYEFVKKSELSEILGNYGMFSESFIPLIGVFHLDNQIIGNISIDNFNGIHFSEESKKLLGYYVDLLTTFLKKGS
ncbi:PAS domain-containing protein [Thermosipho ferrireducens]|uniref:PAS domain-containing protein n=1 Tax=Thermosipho ferrireducens TaxID=2571116 RepID=A0ABX7S9H4_9BACT|nr:PAS domain-containing protein [Thermosipho ferrireducens]QTA38603.1 PAS domain-containing protein [Thermosipho ferrireducens]